MGKWSIRWSLFKQAFITYNGYEQVLTGLRNTVLIAVIGLLIGIVIGTIIAITKVVPKYKKINKVFSVLSDIYVGFFRGTPMVVQLLLGYYVLLPLLNIKLESLYVCIIIFGLNSGAYVSEIMRGGILSIDKGQLEAGRALGLSYGMSMIKIVIPQAIKNIVPTLGNEFITLIKETSIVSFVGAVDLYTSFRYIGSSNYEFMVPYIVMALMYIVLVMFITILIKIAEKQFAKSDRNNNTKSKNSKKVLAMANGTALMNENVEEKTESLEQKISKEESND